MDIPSNEFRTVPDGGAAFPSVQPTGYASAQAAGGYGGHWAVPMTVTHYGMTLRDYFAAQALAGMLAAGCMRTSAAKDAYAFADAMLAARLPKTSDTDTGAAG